MRLTLLETGGTINGILGPDEPMPTENRVLVWLEDNSARLNLQVSAQILFMKDSRAVTEEHRALLAEAIEATDNDHILIPHGTYTMPETGIFLRKQLSKSAQLKSIILVGSLTPLNDTDSDAPAALSFAIDTLRANPVGVWVAMSQKVWHPGEVIKDVVTGEYVGCD